jgi:hypothetical protein
MATADEVECRITEGWLFGAQPYVNFELLKKQETFVKRNFYALLANKYVVLAKCITLALKFREPRHT